MTLEEITAYLRQHQAILNASELARRLGVDPSNLHRVLKGQKDSHGTPAKLPKRCLSAAVEEIKKLQLP